MTVETPVTPDLAALFDPVSVAVVGASASPGKWGYEYSRRLLGGAHRRRVYLVNERGARVHGVDTWRSIDSLPEAPQLAVICVPRDAVPGAVEALLARGTRLLVCITAGFAETGDEGARVQARLMEMVRAAGARLVGPNCLGLFDAAAEFHCTSFWDIPPGRIGVVSQSGTVLLELAERLGRAGHGISRAVSLGNQADIGIEEYVALFADDPHSAAIVAYVEHFRDGRGILAACARAKAAGKEVVLLVPRASEAVGRSVSSHTGSMVAPDRVVDEALADLGLVRVSGMPGLLTALDGLMSPARLAGGRIAILGDGGGSVTMATSAASAAGLEVPAFSPALVGRLHAVANPGCGLSNPVDVVGALDLAVFLPLIEEIAASGEVDGLLLSGFFNNVLSGDGAAAVAAERATGARIVEVARRHGLGLAVASVYPQEPALLAMSDLGIPRYDFPEQAVAALGFGLRRTPRRALPDLPDRRDAPGGRAPAPAADYFAARDCLAGAGIPFARAIRAASRGQALAAAREIGFPVVLKALASSHKSDGGGVRTDLADEAAFLAAFDAMAPLAAPAYSIEAMADLRGGVEILIGAVRDAGFGPTIAVGLGGTLTELLRDTVVALAPVDEAHAAGMIGRLRMAALLEGYRGRPAVDLPALARAVAQVSRLVASRLDIDEAELNPVFALPQGVVAVDARIVTKG